MDLLDIKVKILDKPALKQLKTEQIQAYLKSQGWEQLGQERDWIVFCKNDIQIKAPISNDLADYEIKVQELFEGLEQAENCSQLRLYQKISQQT